MRIRIDNEYDKLEAVLVHRPGREIERLTPENMHRYLFEDIPYLRRMQEEHDAFVSAMRGEGVEVVYWEDLLLDIVREEPARRGLVEAVCHEAGTPSLVEEFAALRPWDAAGLVELLFAGLTVREYSEATGRLRDEGQAPDSFLLPPIPNAYFSRDPAVVVRDAAICCKMHYRERTRETLLIRAVWEHHPAWGGQRIVYGGTDEPTEDRPHTIEGGDVTILSPEVVLIGDSQRTRRETIEKLAEKCLHDGRIKRVYEIPIPKDRAFMHLDTIFTVVDRGVVLWFASVMADLPYVHRYEAADSAISPGVRRVREDRSFLDILRDEFATDVTVVDTGGINPHFAAREQRTDGANVLAIAPRVAITYERNERTVAALEQAGVRCLRIEGSELVRGLGGPRCMTMPLRRSG